MSARLPLFPLGTVLFPGAALPLQIFEPRYRQLMRDLLERAEPRSFGFVAIREGRETGVDGVRALFDVGCVAEITDLRELPDGRYTVLTRGTRRFRLGELDHSRPYLQVEVEMLDERVGDAEAADAAATAVCAAFTDYAARLAQRRPRDIRLPDDATALSYAVAAALPVEIAERHDLLAAATTEQRLAAERELLFRELALLRHLRAAPLRDAPRLPHHLN